MSQGDRPTMRLLTPPTVLTVGCSPRLEQCCAQALVALGAQLQRGKLEQAPTLAATRRPLVIVLTQAVYDFDPREFDALARDVGASLLRVEDDISDAVLEMLLGPALDAALARRQRQGAEIVGMDDPPPLHRKSAQRRSWVDSEAPPSSQGTGSA